ncbi:FAD:protein FMN transferase [Paracoccus sp. (in: a-proteobacteria)]|uniref:FAD:protein FMN transferase n=1 Tax=Paracoccus sp. TaxID=267 RepID=UPI003A85C378
MLTRRRFLTIAAAALAPMRLHAAPLHVETGIALGARVTLRLSHPDAPAIASRAMAEIQRLERMFSLYLPDSALVRLNRTGVLTAPPFEMLDCMTIAAAVHRASGGRFDPTVQPLWRALALAAGQGRPLDPAPRDLARAAIGWPRVTLDTGEIRLQPRMALTLNGIAQGYIADRIAEMLQAEGLSDILIDTGELRALGGQPGGDAWRAGLAQGGSVGLRDRALASSAPLGMTFAGDGRTAHILDPVAGAPVPVRWRGVSVSAPMAALADAVSTAACVMPDRAGILRLCEAFPDVTLVSAMAA